MKARRNESFDKIKITETWAKSLLKRMGYVRRTKTSSTVEILDGARKEIEYQYLYDIKVLQRSGTFLVI